MSNIISAKRHKFIKNNQLCPLYTTSGAVGIEWAEPTRNSHPLSVYTFSGQQTARYTLLAVQQKWRAILDLSKTYSFESVSSSDNEKQRRGIYMSASGCIRKGRSRELTLMTNRNLLLAFGANSSISRYWITPAEYVMIITTTLALEANN